MRNKQKEPHRRRGRRINITNSNYEKNNKHAEEQGGEGEEGRRRTINKE